MSQNTDIGVSDESKLRLGVKLAGLGLGTVDYPADTITLDKRAAELFDLPADEAISRDELHRRIHPSDWPMVEGEVCRLLSPTGDNFMVVEHRIVQANAKTVWV